MIEYYETGHKYYEDKDTIRINNIINHACNFGYMSGIDRDRLRQKETAEVFTPTELVQKILVI